MKSGKEMTGRELQKAAREAIAEHTQEETAERLGISRSSIAAALNADSPTRYAKTLKRIIAEFTAFTIETRTIHEVKRKE